LTDWINATKTPMKEKVRESARQNPSRRNPFDGGMF
jgi:hypothetical protein